MATRKKIAEAQMDPELYKIMKSVYARWTGHELAVVIGAIRKEIEAEQALQAELQQLKELKEQHEIHGNDTA